MESLLSVELDLYLSGREGGGMYVLSSACVRVLLTRRSVRGLHVNLTCYKSYNTVQTCGLQQTNTDSI